MLYLVAMLIHSVASTPPNLLFILADDLGYNELNFMNGTRGIQSPHLDSLAQDGVILKNYYVQPICSPTRSALMTGRYPIKLGTQANVIYWDTPWAPSLENKFMPQFLQNPAQALNYSTAMFGKWHLGMHKEAATPWKRGFDHHGGYLQGCGSGWTHVASCCTASSSPTKDQDYVCPRAFPKDYRGYDWFSDGVPDFSANRTRTAELMRMHALSFLNDRHQNPDKSNQQPFFLYLPFQNIHGPYVSFHQEPITNAKLNIHV
jgi:arylsulfatase B